MTDHSARQATWDANFKAVWHLDEPDTGTPVLDSTAYGWDGTKDANAEPSQADGKIYKGQDFDKANPDKITIGDLDITTSALSLETWIKSSDTGSYKRVISKYSSVSADVRAWEMLVDTSDQAWMRCGGPVYAVDYVTGSVDVIDGAWHYLAGKKDGTAIQIWVDDAEDNNATINTGVNTNDYNLYLGIAGQDGASSPFDGVIDEVRISNVARSDAWFKASYYSGNDSLLAYGEEETPYVVVSAPATSTSEALAPTIEVGIEILAVTAEATSEAPAPIFPHVEISAPTAIATSEALVPIMPNVTIFGVTAVADSEAKVPVIQISYNVAAAVATATSEALVPTIQLGINISPPTATATSEALVPTIAASEEVLAVTALSDSEALVPTILAVQNVDITAVTPTTADGVALAPTITTTWTIDIAAPTATADSEALAPAISCGVNVTAPVAQATSEALAPEISGTGDALVLAVTATADSQAIAPTIELLTEILAITATASSLAYVPAIAATWSIEIVAAVATADSQAYAVSILAQKNVNILALPALATSLALPSVYVGRDLIGLTFTRPVYDALSFTRKVWDAKTFTK